MLAIRLQRTGRRNHAQYRVVVQDSRWHPTNGKVVAHLGSYDPHAKNLSIDKESAQTFVNNGAQPSPRVAQLLKSDGVKLPKWVQLPKEEKKSIRNPEKLRRNQPKEEKPAEAPAEAATETEAESPASEQPAETEATQEATPAETSEAPAEEKPEAETATEDKSESK